MSRVRILNLPNDTTEKELRAHFTKNVPQSAPPLEITDVMIKRLKLGEDATSATHGRGRGGILGAGRGRGAAAAPVPSASPVPSAMGKIRMAFVGFKSSAAGHFVVSYYNGSYYRSSKIKVEIAKGLNEVGVTLNMKKKLEKQQQDEEAVANKKRPRGAEDAAVKDEHHDSTGGGGGGGGSVGGSSSSAGRKAAKAPPTEAREEVGHRGGDVYGERKKTRKELFIDERTQATEGPSWAAEVLVPQTAASPAAGHGGVADSEGNIGVGNEEDDDDDDGMDPEERERMALEKQQALGAVSDLDFLSGLGGGGGGGGGSRVEVEDDDIADDAYDSPARGGPMRQATSTAVVGEDGDDDNDNDDTAMPAQTHTNVDDRKDEEGEEATPEEIARFSRRVRIGNIPYTATEDQVKQFAASLVGPVEEVHVPLTKDTRQSKGGAFVKFVSADDAVRALTLCRGAILMGRLLRVSAAEEDPHSKHALERESRNATATGAVGEAGVPTSLAGSSDFKIKKEMARRGEGGNGSGPASHVSWNTMYMNSSAAVDNVAQRLGVKSDDLVSVQAKGAAVRAAIAEAYLTSEIQQVLSDEGVAFDVIESGQQSLLKARSNTTILAKNLQLAGPSEATELSKLFLRFGTLETSVFPSSGTFALFRFVHPQDARTAFTRLSYKLFKNAPLFLEWAPVGAIIEDGSSGDGEAPAKAAHDGAGGEEADDAAEKHALPGATVVYTLFITNIAFTATEDDFHAFLLDSCPRLAKSPDTLIKRLAFQQQQGRAYLTLADAATYGYCLGRLNGKAFEGRVLSCVPSRQTELDAVAAVAKGKASVALPTGGGGGGGVAAEDDVDETALRKTSAGTVAAGGSSSKVPPGADPYKIIVKNVPFEATEADIRELFSAFSEIKSVRLPRKTNNFTTHRENNHRGFAFVEFLSETEAARAIDVLRATHLYGRHLVLQYAKLDG